MEEAMNTLISKIITVPDLKRPFQDLSYPGTSYSMKNATNLYINVNQEQYIGAWFLVPLKEAPTMTRDGGTIPPHLTMTTNPRSQSFTSLMVDLRQDINRSQSFFI